MKKLTIMMTISALFLVGMLTTYGFIYSEKISKYTTLSADLEEATKLYFETEGIKLDYGASMRVKASTLLNSNLLDSMKVKGDECKGYVIATKKISNYDYKGYIKCNKYKTKGYV